MNRARSVLSGIGVALAACVLISGCGGVVVPKSYDTFNAKDGTVKLKRPAGWEQKRGTAKNFRSVQFSSGPAKIRVLGDVSGSLVGDIASGGQAGSELQDALPEDMADEYSAVAQVHEEMSLRQLSDELGELDVKSTETIESGLGDARKSEFTVSGTLGSTHGYVVTALGHNKRVRVICTCPEKHWETLKPVYDEVVGSIARGQRE